VRRLATAIALAAALSGCTVQQQKHNTQVLHTIGAVVDTAVAIANVVTPTSDVKEATVAIKATEAAVKLAENVTPVQYTVAKGDCLWSIDQQAGGDGFGWYGIYKANRDQITNYDLIEPGMNLTWVEAQANSAANRAKAYAEPAKTKK
jgi:nucleoid-associated protein YgaU